MRRPSAGSEWKTALPLDRGAKRVRTDLDDQPSVQARLMSVIGRVYTNTGDYARADSLLRTALRLRRTQEPASPLAQARTKQSLAYSLFRQGHFEDAERLYREVLDTYRRHDAPGLPPEASALNGLALVVGEQGNPAEAEPLYRRIIARYRANRDSVPGTYYHNLAISLERQNRFDEALAMRRELLPPDHPHLASSLVRLGWLLAERGKPLSRDTPRRPERSEEVLLECVSLPGRTQNEPVESELGRSRTSRWNHDRGPAPPWHDQDGKSLGPEGRSLPD